MNGMSVEALVTRLRITLETSRQAFAEMREHAPSDEARAICDEIPPIQDEMDKLVEALDATNNKLIPIVDRLMALP